VPDLAAVETAIAALESQRSTLGDAVTDTALRPLRQQRRELLAAVAGERRKLVTAVVADLVGYTQLSEQTDPEDLQALLAPYFDAWSHAVAERGGSIEKFIGDAVVAVFGLDVAHEDDPQRAVESALAVRERLDALNAARPDAPTLRIRVGVDTGEVLVGAFQQRPGMDFVAVGDAVNRASRLQTAAPDEGVLVSADTYQHVRGLFVASEREPLTLKGVADPLPVYLVTAAKPRPFYLPTRGVQGVPTRTVGRDGELATLQAVFEDVVEEGQPQLVTVRGDAGVGKSRLLADLANWLELLPTSIWFLRGRATPAGQARPYALLRDVVAERLQLADSDPAETVESRLRDALASGWVDPDAPAKARAIGRLLGFSPDERAAGAAAADPSGPRQRALEHLAEYLARLAEQSPVVVMLEDLHWADDSSLDALTAVLAHLQASRVLVAATARPSLWERRPHWGEGVRGHRVLGLAPLTRRESRALLADVLRHADRVPSELSDLVVRSAEGNPFYLEEMVKWLAEVGVIDTSGPTWHVHEQRLATMAVPPTLRAVLQARIDALEERERAVLQRASVIGRVFWTGAVVRLGGAEGVPVPPRDVPGLLDDLRSREVVYRRERSAFAEDVEFTFKHALLRDVTYDSLLREQRRRLHAAAAEWLEHETAAAGRADEYAVLIAEHLEDAGDLPAAARWYLRAGRAAFGSSAFRESVDLLARARRLATSAPAQTDVLIALAAALDRTGDVEAEEATLAELSSVSAGLDDAGRAADVLLAQASWLFRRSAYDESASCAVQAIGLADEQDDAARQTTARLWRGRALTWQGRHDEARSALEDALRHARAVRDAVATAEALRYLAIVANNIGDYPTGERLLTDALQELDSAGSVTDRASVLGQMGAVLYNAERFEEAAARFEEALRIFTLAGYRYGEAVCAGNLASVFAARNELGPALQRAREALEVVRALDDREGTATTLGLIGDIHRRTGDRERGRAVLEECVRIASELDFHYVESDARLMLALLALDEGDLAGATASARRAVDLARLAGSPLGECQALEGLGWSLLETSGDGSGEVVGEAAEAFDAAAMLADELGLASASAETQVGLAAATLACGDLPGAVARLDRVPVDMLGASTVAPARALLAALRLREAAGDGPGQARVSQRAREWLALAAERMHDDELARGFLRDVPTNAELARAVNGSSSPCRS
jgi:class 3 adenylate cyclase/tetratricopeptide (TPR) repeat protein